MKKYRIRNWPDSTLSLKQHGSLAIWISGEVVANWATDELTGEPGASPICTDLAIETMATVQAVYVLAGRQTQGFLQSIFVLMKLDLTVPDHSTLSRRRRHLEVELLVRKPSRARHLVVDSIGIKVYGEGEWKVRQHGWSKRRTWVKSHLCVDESSLEIVSACVTTNNVGDEQRQADLGDLGADERIFARQEPATPPFPSVPRVNLPHHCGPTMILGSDHRCADLFFCCRLSVSR